VGLIYQIAFLNSAGRPSLHVTNSFACANDASRYARDVMARSQCPALVGAELRSDEQPELLYVLTNEASDQVFMS
jgi:hypothetical protein